MKPLFKFIFNVNALLIIAYFLNAHVIQDDFFAIKILIGLLSILAFFLVKIEVGSSWCYAFTKALFILFLYFQSVVTFSVLAFLVESDFEHQGASEIVYLEDFNAYSFVMQIYLAIAALILIIRFLFQRRIED